VIARLKSLIHRQARPLRYRLLQTLLEHEMLSAEQLQHYQQQQFNTMVRFAIQNTDYYRDRYRGIAGPDYDVAELPVLTKQTVVEQRDAMVAGGLDRPGLKLGYTGGSTGKPLAFYYTDEKTEHMRAGMMRSYRWAGWRPGDRVLNFWGAQHDVHKPRTVADRLRRYAAAEQTLGAYEFSETELLNWARQVQSWRPTLLQGYASILAELAQFVRANNLRMPATIKGVFTTAEVLYDWQRAAIESARRHDPKVVVEAAVFGREIECGVLEGRETEPSRASELGECIVVANHDFYDFDAKYLDAGDVRLETPADVPTETAQRIRAMAVEAFDAAGCEGQGQQLRSSFRRRCRQAHHGCRPRRA